MSKTEKELTTLLFTTLGEVSMCWSEIPKGVFDSSRATELGNMLMENIKEYVSQFTSESQGRAGKYWDEEEFYNLLQAYGNTPITSQTDRIASFDAIKEYIFNAFTLPLQQGEKEIEFNKYFNSVIEHYEALKRIGGLAQHDSIAYDTYRTIKDKFNELFTNQLNK